MSLELRKKNHYVLSTSPRCSTITRLSFRQTFVTLRRRKGCQRTTPLWHPLAVIFIDTKNYRRLMAFAYFIWFLKNIEEKRNTHRVPYRFKTMYLQIIQFKKKKKKCPVCKGISAKVICWRGVLLCTFGLIIRLQVVRLVLA